MIDIRVASKVFLDFVYDNNILPNAIMRIINDKEKEKDSRKRIKYDISVILNILKQRDEYVARNDFTSTYNVLKLIEEEREALSEREMDTPVYDWLKDATRTLSMLIDIRNDFFHDVSKEIDGDTFLSLIISLIKHVPEGYEKNEYLNRLEQMNKNSIKVRRSRTEQLTESFTYGAAGKANEKISRWAKNPTQYNSTIVWAFFKAEAENGKATKDFMRQLCEQRGMSEKCFDSNYASMKTDAGRSHGKVFEDDGETVWIWEGVKGTLLRHKSDFYKG